MLLLRRSVDSGSDNARLRRVLPAAVRPGEGPLIDPTPAGQSCPGERVFMPLSGHSLWLRERAGSTFTCGVSVAYACVVAGIGLRARPMMSFKPTVVGLAMLLEEAGVPSVVVHTDAFAGVARATATANGMPRTRQTFVPQPVVDLSRAELRAYIEGHDPTSGRPFMQEVIEALTRPLEAEDFTGLSFDRSTPRLLAPDSEGNLVRLLTGWGIIQ